MKLSLPGHNLNGRETMRRTLRFLMFAIAVPVLAAAALTFVQSASGQAIETEKSTPTIDIFGGYSYVRANTVVSGRPFNLNGASGSLAYNFKDWLGVVADVGVYHQGNVTANNLSLTVATYQFGPRVTLRRFRLLVPFGQVLVGVGHAGGSLYTSSLGGGLPPLGANNSFVLTAGGGADLKLTSLLSIRLLQAEYLYSQFRNGSTHDNRQDNVRLSAGIVFSFGDH
jgi:hypothetical protein